MKKESKEDIIKYQKFESLKKSNTANSSKKKELETNGTNVLKNQIKKIEHSFSIPKNFLRIHKKKTKISKYKSSLSSKKNNSLYFYNSRKENTKFPRIKSENKIVHFKLDEEEKEEKNDEGKYFQCGKTSIKKMDINNYIKEILTLKNNNGNLSQKIKNELKKRKKIQKLIQYLNMQKYKINKNLVELYLRQSSIERKTSNKVLIINQLKKINSTTSSKNKILPNNLKSSKGQLNSYIKNKNIEKLNSKELNIIKTESFEIKSSYTNINFLSKGKIINDIKYKIFVENFFKKFTNEDNSKIITSLLEKNDKKLLIKEDNTKITEVRKKVIKNNQNDSEVKLPFISQNKNNCEGANNLSKKNGYNNLKSTENLNSLSELKSSKKMQNSLKFFDKKNVEKLKLNNIGLYKKEENINIKNDNNIVNNIKIFSIGKTLFKSKKTNKSKKEKGKNTNMENFLNKLDELNKDNNSKNENISLFADKNHDASGIKILNSKNTGNAKDDKCIIY